MPVKLGDKNLQTSYIKSMLAHFPLPLYEPLEDGGLVIKGHSYIYKGKIVKAVSTSDNYLAGAAKDFEYKLGDEPAGRLEVVDDYRWGEDLGARSSTYMSADSSYDVSTHEYLGRFLRLLRSEKSLDLMPFYNCFLPQNVLGYSIVTENKEDGVLGQIVLGTDEAWDYYLAPMVPGYTYTVGLDSNLGFRAMCVFARNGKIAVEPTNTLHQRYYQKGLINSPAYSSLSRPHKVQAFLPQEWTNQANIEGLQPWWYQMQLLIALPRGLHTSVSVVEGDYVRAQQHFVSGKIPSKTQYYREYEGEDAPTKERQQLMSPLFLNQVNTGESWCFSPRLFEYLIGNVICPEDPFWQNTANVQSYLRETLSPAQYTKLQIRHQGRWTDEMRHHLYNMAIQDSQKGSLRSYVDLTGYVDRDVESLLRGGNYW